MVTVWLTVDTVELVNDHDLLVPVEESVSFCIITMLGIILLLCVRETLYV